MAAVHGHMQGFRERTGGNYYPGRLMTWAAIPITALLLSTPTPGVSSPPAVTHTSSHATTHKVALPFHQGKRNPLAPRHSAPRPKKVVLPRKPTVPPAAHNSPAQPIYDSANPAGIPPGHAAVAVYATGVYAAQPSQVAGRRVLWIDSQASDPSANVLDIENGDASPSNVPSWVTQHVAADKHAPAILYSSVGMWPAVKAAVSSLPKYDQNHVKYWIAQPTGSPHIVPGSQATQYLWVGNSYDKSWATSGFLNGTGVVHAPKG